MPRTVLLLSLVVVGACSATGQHDQDGGGGSGGVGVAGNGGPGGGAGGAVGGRGGAGGCAANQVWCPGCEPGTGACYVGGCPGAACPPPDAGANGGRGGAGGDGGGVGPGGRGGGAGGGHDCGAHVCTSSEICVRPSCGGAPPQCTQLPDGGQCSSGWTYRPMCNNGPTPGPGCEAPPCMPPAPYCITRPASCGATPTCACFPTNVCQGGSACGIISGGEVLCASA